MIENNEKKVENIIPNNKKDDGQNQNKFLNKIIDELGFTKYHVILFICNSIFLLCSGMEEIIHVILLSIINDTQKLSYYHLATMNSAEYLGYTIATILVNIITNYISHTKSIKLFVLFSLLSTGMSLTTYNYYFAAVNRIFLGICLGINDILIYLNLFESAPTEIRGFISTLILLFFPLGSFSLSVACYFQLTERDHKLNFKLLLLIPFIITCLICIIIILFMKESARNLFGQNKIEEVVEIVKQIGNIKDDQILLDKGLKFNKNEKEFDLVDIPVKKFNTSREEGINIDNILDRSLDLKTKEIRLDMNNNNNNNGNGGDNINKIGLYDTDDKKLSFINKLNILLGPQYRKFTILFWIIGSLAGFVFNGIHFMLPATAPKIEKATFLDLILFEGMEIPANFIASLLIENQTLGRLNILKCGFIITFLVSLINVTFGTTFLLFDCFLKFFLTIPLNVLIVYSSEIYDSNIRTMGLSSINFWRKISSLLSPFAMSYITIHFGTFYTYLIYSPLLCLCSILVLSFKTESRGIPLDEIKHLNVY